MANLGHLLSSAEVLLVDFDGPICSIFDGYPAPTVARDIRKHIEDIGIAPHGPIATDEDPMALLPWSSELGVPHVTRLIEDALCDAELRAAETARPTIGVQDMLRAARSRGLPVAIVSNNSARAISRYLRLARLDDLVAFIAGRAYAAPNLMKPHPDVVIRALAWAGVAPRSAVVIGDSVADIDAASAAGTASIGFANRASKYEALTRAGAAVVVDDIATIAAGLRD